MDWWTRRVKVRKPIDWANSWSLEEQAKGLSFEMDSNLNLKALPVVVVDPSSASIVPAGLYPNPLWFGGNTFTLNAQVLNLHTAPVGQDSYVLGFMLEHVGETLAAAGACAMIMTAMRAPNVQIGANFYVEANPTYKVPTVVHYGERGIREGGGVTGTLITPGADFNAGSIVIQLWGYDL